LEGFLRWAREKRGFKGWNSFGLSKPGKNPGVLKDVSFIKRGENALWILKSEKWDT